MQLISTRMQTAINLISQLSRDTVRLAILPLMCVTFLSAPASAASGDTWSELKNLVFKDRIIKQAKNEIKLDAPYRAKDDRRVPVNINAKFVDGRTIKRITLIIDGNPMPVSAVFNMVKPRKEANFSTFMRFNGPSSLRVIVEASDNQLYMTEKFVKTSGLGACAAPPVGDPKELLAGLGEMKLEQKKTAGQSLRASQVKRAAQLRVKHPNLTGLQMDQITLQYILARFVKTIEVSHGDEKLFTVVGSISFSENPELGFDYLYNGSQDLSVKFVDTEPTVFEKTFPIDLGS